MVALVNWLKQTVASRANGNPLGFSHCLILGGCGSGKSRLLHCWFGESLNEDAWQDDKAVVSQVHEGGATLAACGLSDVRAWVRPFRCLSTGQRARARLARLISSRKTFDDFTSTVNRDVGKSLASAIGRYISRQRLRGLVFATPHADVVSFLQPSFVVQVHKSGAGFIAATVHWRHTDLLGEVPKPQLIFSSPYPVRLRAGGKKVHWIAPKDVENSYKRSLRRHLEQNKARRLKAGPCPFCEGGTKAKGHFGSCVKRPQKDRRKNVGQLRSCKDVTTAEAKQRLKRKKRKEARRKFRLLKDAELLGISFSKRFGKHGVFRGCVTEVFEDPEAQTLFHVTYNDGDVEDLNRKELRALVTAANLDAHLQSKMLKQLRNAKPKPENESTSDIPTVEGEWLTSTVKLDKAVQAAIEPFDFIFTGVSRFRMPVLPQQAFHLLHEGGMGLLVGPSGSGKTVLLNKFGEASANIDWPTDRSVRDIVSSTLLDIACLPGDCRDRPFGDLSNGEKFLATLARTLQCQTEEGEGVLLVDEFTSTLDRGLARTLCLSLAKYYRRCKHSRGLLLATCHYDVKQWLQPTWCFDTQSAVFITDVQETGNANNSFSLEEVQPDDCSKCVADMWFKPPKLDLTIVECSHAMWEIFKDHHYLSGYVHVSARCFLAHCRGRLIGILCRMGFPGSNRIDVCREHRLVVLPDFQGLGIGPRFSDAMGAMHLRQGLRYLSRTAHPRLAGYRHRSKMWRPVKTTNGKKLQKSFLVDQVRCALMAKRIAFSYEYAGDMDQRLAYYARAKPEAAEQFTRRLGTEAASTRELHAMIREEREQRTIELHEAVAEVERLRVLESLSAEECGLLSRWEGVVKRIRLLIDALVEPLPADDEDWESSDEAYDDEDCWAKGGENEVRSDEQ